MASKIATTIMVATLFLFILRFVGAITDDTDLQRNNFIAFAKADPCAGVFNDLTYSYRSWRQRANGRCDRAKRLYDQLTDEEKAQAGCSTPHSAQCVSKYMGIAHACTFYCKNRQFSRNGSDRFPSDNFGATPQRSWSRHLSRVLGTSFDDNSKSGPLTSVAAPTPLVALKSLAEVVRAVMGANNLSVQVEEDPK